MSRTSAAKKLNTAYGRSSPTIPKKQKEYSRFEQINGLHPWQEAVPEGYVPYFVYRLQNAKVAYFNFALAKEMGLIPSDHPEKLNSELEKLILDTFAVRIINEYDEEKGVEIPEHLKKPFPHMATRYLQLQHPDRTGRTSGDGRSIWNGCVTYKGKTWDVSSRGTGVTRLAPGVIEAGKNLKTGSTNFGYGCGTADLDEMLGAAVMSEIYHLQGVATERTLCAIDLGKGVGIGVRAGLNLLRPAHLFNHLKQGNLEALKRATDYLIDRENKNGFWDFTPRSKDAYGRMALEMAKRFAWVTARADSDYIFFWLDWDGDNCLANGGIIDYGSIRQFGLRHDEYRYDDVKRFSTSLSEQVIKARQIVQTFAQLAHFLNTGKKKTIGHFKNSEATRLFDKEYKSAQLEWFLYRIGIPSIQRRELLTKNLNIVKKAFSDFRKLERVKTRKKIEKLPDGVNRPAILNMRRAVRELPKLILEQGMTPPNAEELLRIAFSETISSVDARWVLKSQTKNAGEFLKSYLDLIALSSSPSPDQYIEEVYLRSRLINREDRITGNSIDTVTLEIIKQRKNGMSLSDIQKLIDTFVRNQAVLPENHKLIRPSFLHPASKLHKAYTRLIHHVLTFKEDI